MTDKEILDAINNLADGDRITFMKSGSDISCGMQIKIADRRYIHVGGITNDVRTAVAETHGKISTETRDALARDAARRTR